MEHIIPNSDNDLDESLIPTSASSNIRNTRKRPGTSIQESIPQDPWHLGEIDLTVNAFTGISGIKKPNHTSELGFFGLFITEYLVKFLVQESNRYAKNTLNEEEYSNFTLINVDDMNSFICILIYMEINDLPTYEMYWKKKDNPFYNDFCSKLLSFDRFKTIKRFFHVFDNEVWAELESQNIIISKLEGLIEYLNKKFAEVYEPERDLSVDENMCSWSGRGGSKVYMPLKPVKYGIKSYALCESKTGYCCALIQYNSKKPETNLEMLNRLTRNYQNKNHHLYMDNFYTSVKVVLDMSMKGIYCCGTLRDNRGGPKDLKKTVKKFKKGVGLVYNNNTSNCIGLMDNGPVAILTNIHSNIVTSTVNNNNEEEVNFTKSNVVQDYNAYMGGVDLMDQMTKYYEISRRSQKWTTKLCFHVLNFAFYNSYVVYKKHSSASQKKTYLNYLIKIIYELGGSRLSEPYEESRNIISSNAATTQPQLITDENDPITHFPIKIDKRKECTVCKRYSVRSAIKSSCSKCLVPLCVFKCFAEYHNGASE